jgi:hypothetical protein
MKLPEWKPRSDSELRKASAVVLAFSVLSAKEKILLPHLREVLSIAVWKYTECDGKYTTRYRSEGALFATSSEVHHEHVITRKAIVDKLLQDPENAESILATSFGCVVLRSEHQLLATVEQANKSLAGWDRYRAAGITVWDLLEGQRIN